MKATKKAHATTDRPSLRWRSTQVSTGDGAWLAHFFAKRLSHLHIASAQSAHHGPTQPTLSAISSLVRRWHSACPGPAAAQTVPMRPGNAVGLALQQRQNGRPNSRLRRRDLGHAGLCLGPGGIATVDVAVRQTAKCRATSGICRCHDMGLLHQPLLRLLVRRAAADAARGTCRCRHPGIYQAVLERSGVEVRSSSGRGQDVVRPSHVGRGRHLCECGGNRCFKDIVLQSQQVSGRTSQWQGHYWR